MDQKILIALGICCCVLMLAGAGGGYYYYSQDDDADVTADADDDKGFFTTLFGSDDDETTDDTDADADAGTTVDEKLALEDSVKETDTADIVTDDSTELEETNIDTQADVVDPDLPDSSEITGCMLPAATNYMPSATVSDGNCIINKRGDDHLDCTQTQLDTMCTAARTGDSAYKYLVIDTINEPPPGFTRPVPRCVKTSDFNYETDGHDYRTRTSIRDVINEQCGKTAAEIQRLGTTA